MSDYFPRDRSGAGRRTRLRSRTEIGPFIGGIQVWDGGVQLSGGVQSGSSAEGVHIGGDSGVQFSHHSDGTSSPDRDLQVQRLRFGYRCYDFRIDGSARRQLVVPDLVEDGDSSLQLRDRLGQAKTSVAG